MQFNPIQLIINNIMQQFGNNPIASNVIDMAQRNDVGGLEQFARNLGKEKGVDVDQMYKQVMQRFGMSK